MKRRWLLLPLAVCLLPRAAPAQSNSSIGVTTGADAKVGTESRTEGAETRHFERLVSEPSKVNALGTYQREVTPASTPVSMILPTYTPDALTHRWCTICAKPDNTDVIVVGGSGVTTATGFILAPGQCAKFGVKGTNCNELYINAGTQGDGASCAAD